LHLIAESTNVIDGRQTTDHVTEKYVGIGEIACAATGISFNSNNNAF